MIRKFTRYVLMSVLWIGVFSCQDEEVATPPKPSFTADKTSAEVGEDITFTVSRVNADAVSVLPYGLPGNDAGVPVVFPDDGDAIVTFSYARPGTFQAIVVANNHSGDGESVENVKSEPIAITIFSSKSSISAFSFKDVDAEAEIDEEARTIDITVPYGSAITKLVANFTASPFATVTVGGTEQKSGETSNNFSSPVIYRVTANNGTTADYTVNVDMDPIETTNTIKSISAVAVSKNSDEKTIAAFVDKANRFIVVYDTLGTPAAQFDSVRIGYELDGDFAILKYGGTKMKQDSLLNLTEENELVVFPQDSATAGTQAYPVYYAAAPKLSLSFPMLMPDPAADVEPTNFALNINVLQGTDVTKIVTTPSTENPPGVTTSFRYKGNPFVTGEVDYSKPVELGVVVNDTNLGVTTYTVVYTVTVTVVP